MQEGMREERRREREGGRERRRGERRKRNSKGENRLVAGKGGALRAPSFRDMNLDFGGEEMGEGGGVREEVLRRVWTGS